MSAELHAYVLLVLVGFLPNEIWRMLGLVVARGIDEESELFMWARAVATAALAGVPLVIRLGAIACGFAVFLLVRRSVFAGVLVGEIVLIIGALAHGV